MQAHPQRQSFFLKGTNRSATTTTVSIPFWRSNQDDGLLGNFYRSKAFQSDQEIRVLMALAIISRSSLFILRTFNGQTLSGTSIFKSLVVNP
ncbi:MAG TPA: hypothetical protein VKA49_06405 [Flavitalea sp.]|nr:hypothetical protein [Flavitalea sp.]